MTQDDPLNFAPGEGTLPDQVTIWLDDSPEARSAQLEEDRQRVRRQVGKWLSEGKDTFRITALMELSENLGRSRRWLFHQRDQLIDEGVLAEGDVPGTYVIVRSPGRPGEPLPWDDDVLPGTGPAVLRARVYGDTIPAMELAAMDQARDLYGPDALLRLGAMEEIHTNTASPELGKFRTGVTVYCLSLRAGDR